MNDPDKAVREPLATGSVACTDGAADFELDGFRVPVLASAAEEAEKSRLYARSNSSSTSWPLMMGASMLCRRTVRISCHADLTFVDQLGRRGYDRNIRSAQSRRSCAQQGPSREMSANQVRNRVAMVMDECQGSAGNECWSMQARMGRVSRNIAFAHALFRHVTSNGETLNA